MPAKSDVDQQVIQAVHRGCRKFSAIDEAVRSALRETQGEQTAAQIDRKQIDRALQRLRRTGRLSFDAQTGWKALGEASP